MTKLSPFDCVPREWYHPNTGYSSEKCKELIKKAIEESNLNTFDKIQVLRFVNE